MPYKILLVFLLLSLIGCTNSTKKTDPGKKADSASKRVDVPEPDKDLREKYETDHKTKQTDCILLNPDTSLSGIKLRDYESADVVIGSKNEIDNEDHYYFFSSPGGQMLTLTQHPGDGKNTISIFKVEFSGKTKHGYRQLKIDNFTTEKGIRLGLSKQETIDKLGHCYTAKDSSKNYIELYYLLQEPQDSKTRLLERQNMPIYYASYKFWNNQLRKFEFGFEYP
jgi:hypothetical protein